MQSGGGKLLWLIPIGCLGLLLVCGGLGAAIFTVVRSAMRSSEPYQVAVSRATANAEVVAALGSPITEGMFASGSISTSGGSGNADLTIPLKGPSGSGTVSVQAKKFAGRWEYTRLVATVDGRQIDLLAPSDTPSPELH